MEPISNRDIIILNAVEDCHRKTGLKPAFFDVAQHPSVQREGAVEKIKDFFFPLELRIAQRLQILAKKGFLKREFIALDASQLAVYSRTGKRIHEPLPKWSPLHRLERI